MGRSGRRGGTKQVVATHVCEQTTEDTEHTEIELSCSVYSVSSVVKLICRCEMLNPRFRRVISPYDVAERLNTMRFFTTIVSNLCTLPVTISFLDRFVNVLEKLMSIENQTNERLRIPPIDQTVPENLCTATFALG